MVWYMDGNTDVYDIVYNCVVQMRKFTIIASHFRLTLNGAS